MIEEYNYNEEESGRTETLIKSLEKIELLEKKLDIAIKTLEEYGDCENWYNIYRQDSMDECPLYWGIKWKKEYGYKLAHRRLKQIKELKYEDIISKSKSKSK